jgi:hypothetical protein
MCCLYLVSDTGKIAIINYEFNLNRSELAPEAGNINFLMLYLV